MWYDCSAWQKLKCSARFGIVPRVRPEAHEDKCGTTTLTCAGNTDLAANPDDAVYAYTGNAALVR